MKPSEPFRETRALSWEEVHQAGLALAQSLRHEGPWQGILAIARGGLIPAATLAFALGIRRIETLAIASYDGKRQGTPGVSAPGVSAPGVLKDGETTGEGWLAVDDIADTGKTAETVRTLLPEASLVTLYAKPDGLPYIDRCAVEMPQDIWLVFPWEGPDAG